MYYGSSIFSGQRFFAPTSDAWNPVAVGPVRATVPAPIPTAAPMNSGPSLGGFNYHGAGAGMGLEAGYSGFGSPGGGGLLDFAGNGSILLIGLLVVGLLWLQHVHFAG